MSSGLGTIEEEKESGRIISDIEALLSETEEGEEEEDSTEEEGATSKVKEPEMAGSDSEGLDTFGTSSTFWLNGQTPWPL